MNDILNPPLMECEIKSCLDNSLDMTLSKKSRDWHAYLYKNAVGIIQKDENKVRELSEAFNEECDKEYELKLAISKLESEIDELEKIRYVTLKRNALGMLTKIIED